MSEKENDDKKKLRERKQTGKRELMEGMERKGWVEKSTFLKS